MVRHAKAGVVVHAGDDLGLGSVGQTDAADHVHLPELHGLGPLPALVVGAFALEGLGVIEPWRIKRR